jgi:predicted nucleotidyltransferase
MKVVGLIVEYNPLHYGHQYHFEQSNKKTGADAVVIVMSGNFLQRGEPALVNKWARTEMALEMGVDLVFELPYVYATQQAQHFAYGAISILNHLPFVTHLCFGSESGEIEAIQDIASLLAQEPSDFQQKIKEEMSKGQSYPSAYATSLQYILTTKNLDPALVSEPNNILGLNYLISLKQLQSHILPVTIKRDKAGFHEKEFVDQKIASATSIRHALLSPDSLDWEKIRPFVPKWTFDILKKEASYGRGPVSWENYFPYVAHSFLSQSSEQLRLIYEMEEGIENRFKEKIKEAITVEHLCQLVKSKRYTWNRIQRMISHTYTQFLKQDATDLHLEKGPSYLRLLGFSKKGKELLNGYKKELQIPIISSIRKDHPPMLDWDIKAATLHSLGYKGNVSEHKKREFSQPPLLKDL